ncbi:unnamed protein product [Mytilus edulis]|uniref:C-type lectin domain-containing protein n=1 Tax=Mytilus edulis TaxID=6550 RepID=A0A8S3TFE8_MYTED|nr:unnamed protein product [Mytilus edulis]
MSLSDMILSYRSISDFSLSDMRLSDVYLSDISLSDGFCRTYNSHLATIETEGENIFLTDTIALIQNGVGKRDIHDLTQDFWIGGTDEVIEGVWVWASTGKDLTYTNWEPGQPDNWKNENCLSLVWWNIPGKWNDWYCSRNCHFICETELQNLLEIQHKEIIRTTGIYSSEVYKREYWIGGTDEVFENVWVWASTGKQFSYTNWYAGNPDNWKKVENCLELLVLLEIGVPGKWNDADCSLQVQFICEMEYVI